MPGASAKCLDRKFLDADQLLDWPLLMQWTAPATGIACRLLAISGLFVGVSGTSALPQKADVTAVGCESPLLTPSRLRWQSVLVLFDSSNQGALDGHSNAEM